MDYNKINETAYKLNIQLNKVFDKWFIGCLRELGYKGRKNNKYEIMKFIDMKGVQVIERRRTYDYDTVIYEINCVCYHKRLEVSINGVIQGLCTNEK